MHPLRQNPARISVRARRTVTAGTLVAGAAAAALVAGPAGAASTSTTTTTAAASASATGQYNAALKAVGSQGVHFVSIAKQSGAELEMSAVTPAPTRARRRSW